MVSRKTNIKTAALLKEIIEDCLSPPEKITVSEWADRHRIISIGSSAEPGQWRTSRAPYQREIMDSVNDPAIEEIVVMSAARVGKTEILNNIIGYFIDYDPGPILMVQPSVEFGESFSKDNIAPMIRDCPVLKNKVMDEKAKSSGNTITNKQFPGGRLIIVGANAPTGLSGRNIRILLCDEVDRYPASAGTEGDPVKLAMTRTTNFWNRKIIKVSTPTLEGSSRIEVDYLASSRGEWCLPCPTCGAYQPLSFRRIDRETALMECEHCKAMHSQYEWKADGQRAGEWIHEEPKNPRKGFHLNALASPWLKWEKIIADFLESKKNPEMLKTFVNTVLGEVWQDRGAQIEESVLEKRSHYYNCQVPDGAIILTAGVDVQDDRLEVEVVGWGEGEESWGIEYAILLGDPRQSGVWKSLDEYLVKAFLYGDGRRLNILATCIDSGGHATDEVYKYCAAHEHMRVFAIKGKGGFGVPISDRPHRNNKYRCLLFILGVDALKDLLHARLKIEHEGAGYCHFPKEGDRGYSEDILKGFISEQKHKEKNKAGRIVYVWKKKGGVRNEPLDCRNYATAALKIMNPNFEYWKNAGKREPSTPTKKGWKVISKGVTL